MTTTETQDTRAIRPLDEWKAVLHSALRDILDFGDNIAQGRCNAAMCFVLHLPTTDDTITIFKATREDPRNVDELSAAFLATYRTYA